MLEEEEAELKSRAEPALHPDPAQAAKDGLMKDGHF